MKSSQNAEIDRLDAFIGSVAALVAQLPASAVFSFLFRTAEGDSIRQEMNMRLSKRSLGVLLGISSTSMMSTLR